MVKSLTLLLCDPLIRSVNRSFCAVAGTVSSVLTSWAGFRRRDGYWRSVAGNARSLRRIEKRRRSGLNFADAQLPGAATSPLTQQNKPDNKSNLSEWNAYRIEIGSFAVVDSWTIGAGAGMSGCGPSVVIRGSTSTEFTSDYKNRKHSFNTNVWEQDYLILWTSWNTFELSYL